MQTIWTAMHKALGKRARIATLSIALLPFSNIAHALPGTPEQRAACTPDVMRLCRSDLPHTDRVISCMLQNKERVSTRCRVAVGF